VPGIHVFMPGDVKDVDGRDKPGHDEFQKLRRMLEPNGGLRVEALPMSSRASCVLKSLHNPRGKPMVITAAHITPLVALIAGILILILPRLLNIIVAAYLIIFGLMGLNAIHHWVQ
jgi:hypothetical protein